MKVSAIEFLVEYPISRSDFERMDDDEIAVLSILSYAVSESHTLRRLYLFSSHELEGEDAIDSAIAIQRFVLLRASSAKLFEVAEFLSLGGKKKTTDNPVLIELAEVALTQFKELRERDGYRIARKIRHEATHHYSLSAAKKNLSHLGKAANRSMYLHRLNGNSFYPLGEEVMFIAGLNKFGANLRSKAEKERLFSEWFDWNVAADKWLHDVHYSFHKRLVLDRFPDAVGVRKPYWVSPKLVGSPKDTKVPLFLRIEEDVS